MLIVPSVSAYSPSSTIGSTANASLSLGWGGYIASTSQAESILTVLNDRGYNALRYEAVAPFLSASYRHKMNFAILDYIVQRGAELGITIVIDPIHNYPPTTSSTMRSRFTDWQAELRRVASRYNNYTNVILECVNEYTLSDGPQKFKTIVNDLRGRGITLPLHFNLWWGSTIGRMTAPTDPLNKVSVGHHIYGDHNSDASYMRSGESWIDYCKRIGVEDRVRKMFTSSDSSWFGYALARGTKVLLTEVGGSNREVMTPYNVAFLMRTFEYAQQYNVGIIGFRVGDYGNLQIYESKAQQYFHRSLFNE